MAATPMQSVAQEQGVNTTANVQWAFEEMAVYVTVWEYLTVAKMLTSVESAVNYCLCYGLTKIYRSNVLFFNNLFFSSCST